LWFFSFVIIHRFYNAQQFAAFCIQYNIRICRVDRVCVIPSYILCIRSDYKISWVIYFVVPIQWAHAIAVTVTVIIIIISPPHVVFINEEWLSLEETIPVGSSSSTLYLLIFLSVLARRKTNHLQTNAWPPERPRGLWPEQKNTFWTERKKKNTNLQI